MQLTDLTLERMSWKCRGTGCDFEVALDSDAENFMAPIPCPQCGGGMKIRSSRAYSEKTVRTYWVCRTKGCKGKARSMLSMFDKVVYPGFKASDAYVEEACKTWDYERDFPATRQAFMDAETLLSKRLQEQRAELRETIRDIRRNREIYDRMLAYMFSRQRT